MGPSTAICGNIFELTGANGSWTQLEQHDQKLEGTDGYPCSSFSCVKNCSLKVLEQDSNNNVSYNKPYEDGVNSCPDVTFKLDSAWSQPTATPTLVTHHCHEQFSSAAATDQQTSATSATRTTSRSTSATAATGAAATGAASPRRENRNFFLIGLSAISAFFLIRMGGV